MTIDPTAPEYRPPATAVAPPRVPTAPPAEPAPPPLRAVPTSAGFAEETRLLLRRRLLITHAAVGLVTGVITALAALGAPILPCEAGLGRWAIGLPLLAFGQSVAGLAFLVRRADATLAAYRLVEVTQFAIFAVVGGAARYLVLANPPPASLEPRFPILVYRFDAVLTNYSFVFGIIFYGVLIPNTPRRSLVGAGLLCLVPAVATAAAYAVNPDVRSDMPAILPVSGLPLCMAGVIAVFSATRNTALRRQAFEARREAEQVGAYTLQRKLGEGGMGEVFLAEHRLLKRPCAVKFVRADLAANPATAARFEREVRAITGLGHFNTVRVYDYGRADDGAFYYVMEYLDGPTLDRLVRDRGPLPPGRAVYLLRQLCGALAEAHAAGLVHRDLKPGNILVATLGGQHDVAKLLDFGLVHELGSSADVRLTQTGAVLGTPAYMCPEQAAGEAVTDARGDIYSLGAVAFFVLAGRPPFDSPSVGKLIAAHLTQAPPVLDYLRPEVPADLAAVVARCLAKNPADRYQSAIELEAALAACDCAADWSATDAAEWWAASPARDTDTPDPDRTRTAVFR
jgi:serine/threonine-protein kinase